MSFTPTRMLNKNSPLSDMTLDQMLLIHGEMPTLKSPLPPRTPGRALTHAEKQRVILTRTSGPNPDNTPHLLTSAPAQIQQIASVHAQEILEAKKKNRQPSRPPVRNQPRPPVVQTPSRTPAPAARPTSPTATSRPARPQPGKAHVLVAPTPDGDQAGDSGPDISMQEPCMHLMELVFEIELPTGPAQVAYPMFCEVLGRHPNQPHMMKVYGRSADPDDPDQDVFVGWGDVLE